LKTLLRVTTNEYKNNLSQLANYKEKWQIDDVLEKEKSPKS